MADGMRNVPVCLIRYQTCLLVLTQSYCSHKCDPVPVFLESFSTKNPTSRIFTNRSCRFMKVRATSFALIGQKFYRRFLVVGLTWRSITSGLLKQAISQTSLLSMSRTWLFMPKANHDKLFRIVFLNLYNPMPFANRLFEVENGINCFIGYQLEHVLNFFIK